MTRLITLRLGATTDERHCGDCPSKQPWPGVTGARCGAFARPMSRTMVDSLRLPECLAAEAETKRLVAVEEAARDVVSKRPHIHATFDAVERLAAALPPMR
jgi:hypothetical protein